MKKKPLLIIGLIVILILSFSVVISASNGINVYVDGQKLKFDTPPQLEAQTTLVPMRAVFEAIGADVSWHAPTKTVLINKANTTVSIHLNNKYAYKNNTKIELDIAAKTINNRIMVPLRFVAESLDCQVDWSGKDIIIKTETAAASKTYKIIKVIDGDTIEIDYNGTPEKVRLIGIDTPESVHPDEQRNVPYGKIAADFTKNQLQGEEVELEFDVQKRDKYNRLLAYVYLNGKMFNKILLEQGHAAVATFPPNVKYVDDFIALEKTAQAKGIGIWETYGNQASNSGEKNNMPTKSGTYMGSLSSDKFHDSECAYALKIKEENRIFFATIEEARQKGYTACSVCDPK
ncbi:MAG: stalk domain-containing protein [Bacillota bacterium]|jgi:micrococcal nuclease